MSYTIRVRIRHTSTDACFRIAEMAVWHFANGGAWTETDGILTLTMGGSGTSGMLRLQTQEGEEAWTLTAGIHNYKPWVHIITDVARNETSPVLLPQYYGGKFSYTQIPRAPTASARNRELRTFTATFGNPEGRYYPLDVVIGRKS
ncbi:fruit body lectin [Nemania sp. FL0916]|nr:fruit body lectin [Nemania sp. FL0916]